MWQYNYDYLCHKATYKYIDKYRDKRGNWVYIYNEPETGKRKQFSGVPTSQKQKMVEANRRGAEAAEKARGMAYGNKSTGIKITKLPNGKQFVEQNSVINGDNIRFPKVANDLLDYDKAEKTKQALKNATDKAARRQKEYEDKAAKRQKQYEANAKGAEEAEKARGMVQQQQQITKRKNAAKEQLSVAYNKIDDAKKQILKGNYDKASEILNEGLNMSNEAITIGELGDNNYMDLVNEMLRDPKVNKKIYKDKVLFAPTYRK